MPFDDQPQPERKPVEDDIGAILRRMNRECGEYWDRIGGRPADGPRLADGDERVGA